MKRFLKACLKEISKQIFGTKQPTRIIYTKNTRSKMGEHRITEKQINEVFNRGKDIKEGMRTRDYNGYQIGIVFAFDKERYGYVIISCWKRGSRK